MPESADDSGVRGWLALPCCFRLNQSVESQSVSGRHILQGSSVSCMQGPSPPQRAAPRPLSEEEKLAAQGVPPEIIASMRSFNALAFSRPPPQARQRQTEAVTPFQPIMACLKPVIVVVKAIWSRANKAP